MSKIKNLFLLGFLFSLQFLLFSIDFGNLQGPLAGAFEDILDKNEGLTSFRSLYIPPGGRAEATGGAFTALANDIGFFDYNPAASSTLDNTELAVFHNAWIADSAMETIAFTQRQKHLGYGAQIKCFYVPFTQYNIFGERISAGYYSETTATLNIAYNFFAGYNFKGIAVGMNLKGSYRSVPDYANSSTDNIIDGSGLGQSAVAVMADFGIQMRFNFFKNFVARDPNLYIGLAMVNLGAAFTGFGKTTGAKLDDPLPTHVSAGISYQPFRPIRVSLEFQQPINLQNIKESEQWSAGAGITAQFTNFFSFHGGFLMRGANPRFSIGAEFLVKSVQMNVNYTLDLTTSFTPINRISLGAKVALGDGGRAKQQSEVDALYSKGLALYAEGKLDQAIDQWTQALAIDPRFDPAILGIKTAQHTRSLQQQMTELQRLEQ